ncbi:MAG: hypothetical protein CSB48_08680 [Proteobacteria bacterium]|nr:MAG: hypothetical protein CSB48_08680 [Pseudomonadota bacterium]
MCYEKYTLIKAAFRTARPSKQGTLQVPDNKSIDAAQHSNRIHHHFRVKTLECYLKLGKALDSPELLLK